MRAEGWSGEGAANEGWPGADGCGALAWRGLAMGALALVAAVGRPAQGGVLPAFEVVGAGTHEIAAAEPGAGAQAVSLAAREYRIAAGPLGEALQAFEAQSGLRLRVSLKKEALAGFVTRGVEGKYEPKEALRLLLDGTGLTSSVEEQGAAVGLSRSDEATVTAEIPDALAMTKFTEPLVDTPQSVVAVPQFVMKDEAANTLRDALRNVPGISMAAGEFGAQGDNLTIRGFTARNDIFLDGIRDFGSYYRDSFDYEQVEVLEGPAGVQFGRGSTGGVINQESKVATPQRFLRVLPQFGTNGTTRLALDGNLPLPQLGAGTAVRLNAVATQGGVAGRPYAANRHYGLAPSIGFGYGGPTRGSLSYFHLTENDTPDYGLPWFYGGVSAASRYSYFGFPDSNYLRASVDVVTARFDHDFSPAVSVHSIGRFANYGRDAQITEPQICSNPSVAVPVGGWAVLPTSAVAGGGACPSLLANPATIRVNRNELQVKSVEGDLWNQTEVTARFKLHGIANNFAGGAEGGKEVSSPIRTSYVSGSVPATTLLNPNPQQAFAGRGYVATITHTTSRSAGVYFVDTLKLGRYIEASGGVRWDYFDTNYNTYGPPNSVGVAPSAMVGPLVQIVHQPTYRAALVYKPTQHGSVYFDWGTSFNPSAESLSLSLTTFVLPPEQNETYEAGAKYSFLGDRLMVDGAWFRTTKLNARETSPTDSTQVVLAGTQRVQGVQASAVGRLRGGMDLVLGYAYLNSEVVSSTFFPTSVGYQLANVPKQTFNAFVTRRILGFTGGLGGNYVASRTASSTVPFIPLTYGPATTFRAGTAPCGTATTTVCAQVLSTGMRQVPGYWVFNAMVSHPVTEHIELQANVYNMLNRYYIDQPHPSHLIPGEGVNALIGGTFRF